LSAVPRRSRRSKAPERVRAANRVAWRQSLQGESLWARADSLTALAVPLHVIVAEDRLTEIPGVGDAIADIITKLSKSGTHPSLEKLRKGDPRGRARVACRARSQRRKKCCVSTRISASPRSPSWKPPAKDDRVKKAKGLGAALQTKILQNLAIAKSGEGRLHLHRAAALLAHAKDSLRKARPELKRVTVAGDFRRGLRTRR